jgi:formate hydrogenlyase subunit 3/multisubunit Na+/H+ antiporter MnhD subunit
MSALDHLLLFSAASVLLVLLLGNKRFAGWLSTLFYAVQFGLLMKLASVGYGADVVASSFSFTVLDFEMSWRFDALSWFFAVITICTALLASWYSSGVWGKKFRADGGNIWLLHLALSLNVFSMLLLLASGDFLSLFVGWELVSWASFLLMVLAGGAASRAALKYVTYAMGGAMAILAGLALVYHHAGSLQYHDFVSVLPSLSITQSWVLFALFGAGFAVKMGLLPFHLWQAAAYAETPGPGAAFLGAISARMGLYAIIVVLFQLIGLAHIESLKIPFTFLDGQTLLGWIAVLTIIIPTYTALRQNDARMLLAWHGIGQGGYMLLGLATGDALGSAGGLLHIFNYAACQAALLLSVFAVRHQTGTSDLNKLGGLITRMPISFLIMLVGIIGLAGMPPMNGFVSKWMIYRSLMLEGMPLLFVASIIGTLGTILSVYKLIHNMFLGQLRLEHQNVREVPWSMVAPMVILAAIVLITGMMPGLVLQPIASVQVMLGLPVANYTLGGVEMATGSLDMLWISGILFAGFGVGAVLFYSTGRTQHIHQLDNYAGGHFLTADTRYQYSDNFYAGLMRVIGPLYRYSFLWFESSVYSVTGLLGSGMKVLYRNAQPSFYLLATTVLAMAWVVL